ncbi:MAG: hypothetical protein LCI00_32385 [Chloroflexi bacterium]|nr:hypothetical protein [Chloroflexota bacterium]MCC6894639.1 hypothetical protein [Anaerolineae bacterium]
MSDRQNVQITLTPDELKTLVHDAVRDALLEVLGEDMSTEPNFAPEIAERLRRYRDEKPQRLSVDDVVKDLGLSYSLG